MDYKKIIVPFLRNVEIEEGAGWLRKKFWDDKVPVDIEYIIDNKLEIDIIPIPNFLKLIGGVDIKTLNSYLAIPLSETFKVSDEVVAIALDDI